MGDAFQIGPWLVDPGLNTVSCSGQSSRVEPKVMAVLVCLSQHTGETLSKELLLQTVWAGTFVSDDVLTRAISELRRVFEDDAKDSRIIQTIPRRGYRLLAPVRPLDEPPGESVALGKGTFLSIHSLPRRSVLLVATALVGLVIVGHFVRSHIPQPPDATQTRVLVAVLPFENLTGNPSRDFFGDGLTEEMITQLGSLNHDELAVIARTSVMSYRNHPKPVDSIGRELGVEYLLEGSFRGNGDQLRISAKLIRVRDQTYLWTAEYDGGMQEIVSVQGDVARSIAKEIRVQLTPEAQARIATARSSSPEAYEAYFQGQYYWNRRTPEALKKSLDYYHQAVSLDPGHAPAHAGLARAYFSLGTYAVLPSSDAFSKAKAAANRAVELDRSLAEGHGVLAVITDYSDWDWPAAEREYREALDLNPSYATAHHWFAMFLARMGRFDEAFAEIQVAHNLDPLSMIINSDVGGIFLYRGSVLQDIEQQHKTLEIDPNFPPAHANLGWAYEREGRYDEAIQEWQTAIQMTPANLGYKAALARAFGLAGQKSRAERILSELTAASGSQYVSPYSIATVYLGLGDKAGAFKGLERAYREHDFWMAFLKVDPRFVTLHSDSRFQELLHRMRLPANGGAGRGD